MLLYLRRDCDTLAESPSEDDSLEVVDDVWCFQLGATKYYFL